MMTATNMAQPFQSTLSMRRATRHVVGHARTSYISIHALHEESDHSGRAGCVRNEGFQSTLSMRRATGQDGVT